MKKIEYDTLSLIQKELSKDRKTKIALSIAISSDGTKAYVACGYGGVVIFDIADIPIQVGSFRTHGYAFNVALSSDGTKAYVVNYTHSKSGRKSHLITVDISDASNPTKICKQTIPKKNAHNIVLSKNGKRAFIDCGEYLEVVDIKTEEEV